MSHSLYHFEDAETLRGRGRTMAGGLVGTGSGPTIHRGVIGRAYLKALYKAFAGLAAEIPLRACIFSGATNGLCRRPIRRAIIICAVPLFLALKIPKVRCIVW